MEREKTELTRDRSEQRARADGFERELTAGKAKAKNVMQLHDRIERLEREKFEIARQSRVAAEKQNAVERLLAAHIHVHGVLSNAGLQTAAAAGIPITAAIASLAMSPTPTAPPTGPDTAPTSPPIPTTTAGGAPISVLSQQQRTSIQNSSNPDLTSLAADDFGSGGAAANPTAEITRLRAQLRVLEKERDAMISSGAAGAAGKEANKWKALGTWRLTSLYSLVM